MLVGALVVLALLGGLVKLTGGGEDQAATAKPSAGAEPTEESAEKVKPSPTSTALRRTDREVMFLFTVKQRVKDADDAELVKLGWSICKALDDGGSLAQVATSGVEAFGLETSAYVAGAAIVSLCPRHKAKIPS
ncbi:DUF732 domain-containing protein [Streptosporangium amethystogenes subsp. fukuiense]|uniref:DUF732 domain-containing protein n=1 Tax=Streptosporangium amethystogenes subsp. fukuiense TaxID=698418 RepID=A0ABW2STP2_9ACTN